MKFATTIIAAITLITSPGVAGSVPIEVIAAPGGGFGTTSTAFTTARINASGQVQFVARIPDDPDPVYSAVYVGVPGSLTQIAREGPFFTGEIYINDLELNGVSAPISDAGDVFMYYQLAGPGITFDNDRQVSAGGVHCAGEGDIAPGTGGLHFKSFTSILPRINSQSMTAFPGTLEAGTPLNMDSGLWVGGPGGTMLHVREGDPAPGMPAGATFFSFDSVSAINDAGQILFRGRATGTGIDSSNDHGLWLGTVGAPVLVAREGDPVPGVAGDVNFGSLSDWSVVNNAGQMAFFTLLTGADVVFETNNCIMTGTIGNLSMVVRTGDVAPGAGGAVFSFFDHPVIDGTGRIAFRANLTGAGVDSTNDRGIWAGYPGALTLVAREGGTPPDADPGDEFDTLNHPVLNANGQLAFHGLYRNSGSTYKAIWATDTSGVLTEVIRAGDMIDLGGGDLRTVLSAELEHRSNFGSGGQDGRPRCLNDAGQLAFDVTFTDGMRAIVRASVGDGGTVPCPADVDGSGVVDVNDLLGVLAAWGVCGGCPEDIDGDGMVSVTDLLSLLAGWGGCP